MAFSICYLLIIYALHVKIAECTDSLEQDWVYVSQLKSNKLDDVKIKRMDRTPHKIQFDKDSPSNKDFFNPCSYKNGGCQHKCLIKSTTRYRKSSCACNFGYNLKSNLKDCELKHLTSETYDKPSELHRIRRRSLGLFVVRSALRKNTRGTSAHRRRLRGQHAARFSDVDANKAF